MKPLTKETRSLIAELSHVPMWPRSAQGTLETIRAIAGRNELPAVLPLVDLLSSHRQDVIDAAERAIDTLLATASPDRLAQLDGIMREFGEWRLSDRIRVHNRPIRVTGLLASHPNGYVREAAVRELAIIINGEELPFLLLRANDWVAHVRALAEHEVRRRMVPAYALHFLSWLPLVERLRQQQRATGQSLARELLAFLQQAPCRHALETGLDDPEQRVRRLAFRTLIDAPGGAELRVLENAVASTDNQLRISALNQLIAKLEGMLLQNHLVRLRNDRFMPLRREALAGLITFFPESSATELRSALCDPHVSIREMARFHLRKRGETEFASHYAEWIRTASEQDLATAIAGLGETGNASHAVVVAPFCRHEKPRVRAVALRALAKLDFDHQVVVIANALVDSASKVSGAALASLLGRNRPLSAEQLHALLLRAGSPHSVHAVLALTAELTWWDAAWVLVEAHLLAPSLRDEAATQLANWRYNTTRLYVRPTAEQRLRLRKALQRVGTALGAQGRDDIAETLAYAERTWK